MTSRSLSSLSSTPSIPEEMPDPDNQDEISKLFEYLDRDYASPVHERFQSYSEHQMIYLVHIILDILTHLQQNEALDSQFFKQDPEFHIAICSRLATLAISSRTAGWDEEQVRKCELVFQECIPDLQFKFGLSRDVVDEYFDITLGWSRYEVNDKEKIMAARYFQGNLEVANAFDILEDQHFYRDWKFCGEVACLLKERYNLRPTILQLIYIRRQLLRNAIQVITGMERVFFRVVRTEFGVNNFPVELDVMYNQMMASYVDFSDGPGMSETRVRWAVLIQMIRSEIKRDLMAGVGRGPISHDSLGMLDKLAEVYQKTLLTQLL